MEPTITSTRPAQTLASDVVDGSQARLEPAMSLHELATELYVSDQTIYDLRSQGRGPKGFRAGRCLRFRRSEIEAWLARLEEEDLDRHPEAAR